MRILGIDSGFATMGLAVVERAPLGESMHKLVHLEFHGTEKVEKKARRMIRACTDDARRVLEMVGAVEQVVREHEARGRPIQAIAVEWFAPNPRQKGFASGGWKAAISVGAVMGLACGRRLPVLEQLPGDIKSLVGDRGASKAEVEAWLVANLRGFREAIARIPRSKREHPSDAAAHALVGLLEMEARRKAAGLF